MQQLIKIDENGQPVTKILVVNNFLQDKKMNQFVLVFEKFLKNYFNQYQPLAFQGHQRLLESIRYTLFTSGKRFRPLLIFSTAKICGLRTNLILPWAGAIEIIHTASLIHDDLPCMDNSYSRRNKQLTTDYLEKILLCWPVIAYGLKHFASLSHT